MGTELRKVGRPHLDKLYFGQECRLDVTQPGGHGGRVLPAGHDHLCHRHTRRARGNRLPVGEKMPDYQARRFDRYCSIEVHNISLLHNRTNAPSSRIDSAPGWFRPAITPDKHTPPDTVEWGAD